MRIRLVLFVISAALTSSTVLAAPQEKTVAAGLFKNGLAVITREYTVPGPGSHVFKALDSPVHGTLWVESDVPVVARSGTETVEVDPGEAITAGPGQVLVGKEVEIGLRMEGATPFTGVLVAAPGPALREALDYRSGNPVDASPTMYVIEREGLRSFLAPDMVAYVRALEPTGPVKEERPVLVLEVGEGAPNPTVIRVRYLAHGLSWAPTYRLDLTDEHTLRIGQSAAVRNELEDLEGVALDLISGFPNVEFLQVASPFATDATWRTFLAQLAQGPAEFSGVVTQQILSNNLSPMYAPGPPALPTFTPDDGADIHYEAIGPQSLRRGGALVLTTGEATSPYERVVEWTVDRRRQMSQDTEAEQEAMWDAVRFQNPFTFPLSTGPAMVEADGRFLGSKTIRWTSPGGTALAYVSKALSVRGDYEELELSRREIVELGHPAIQSTVQGKLTVRNQRAEAVSMIIHEEFDGSLRRADGEPESVVGASGPGRRNQSTRLTWNLTLAPGEERVITLEYLMIVR